MRYRELTTPELEQRLERFIADRYHKQLAGNNALQNAIQQGVESGHARYVANLMPGREAQQREILQRQQRKAERQRNAQQRLATLGK
jgi:uncharacterized protein YllA (UPF0747 family)